MDINEYFNKIREQFYKEYEIAKKARENGYDPENYVEITISEDMAERVENLIASIDPIVKEIDLSKNIREIEKQFKPLTFKTILKIAEYTADKIYEKTKDKIKSIELGLRVAFAYHTLGVVAAPTEGIVKVSSKKRLDGKEYIAIYYAGPVRSAGGTPTAFSVVIADFLRKKFGYEKWDPTEDEINRTIIEIFDYKRVAHLQYTPKREELEFCVKNLPVEVTGEPTIDVEVSGYKDLPRIETNRIRGGMALVIAEGVIQKAGKIWKGLKDISKEMNLEDWKWLDDLKKIQEKLNASSQADDIIKPNWKYLSQITAGRAILSLPSSKGGFRLRYGKSRTNGLEAISIHPSVSYLTLGFLAFGTQMVLERPGKAGAITFSDTIEPPVVRLKNGDVIIVKNENIAKKIVKKKLLDKILFLGDILITYGDFLDNGHLLVPAGYCEEWWVLEFDKNANEKVNGYKIEFDMFKPRKLFKIEGIERLSEYLGIDVNRLEKLIREPLKYKPNFVEALKISILLDVPLHPKYLFMWKDISLEDLVYLKNKIKEAKLVKTKDISIKDKKIKLIKYIILEYDEKVKRILEDLLVPHFVRKNKIIIPHPYSSSLYIQIGINSEDNSGNNVLELINKWSIVKIRDKVGTYIGARMGRPEKARIREMKGSVMVLFPVGDEGGRMRNLMESLNYGKIEADLVTFYCKNCGKIVPYRRCPYCNEETKIISNNGIVHKKYYINIRDLLNIAIKNLKIDPSQVPKIIKGPRGLSSKDKYPERIEKGILRAKYGLFVFRDGIIRFDGIEVPLTYFKPKDLVYTPIEKLRELGYTHDIYGNPLVSEDQILELKPQDVILPTIGPRKKGGKILPNGTLINLMNAAKFVDELLEKFYNLEKYYNVKKPEDLIGKLIIVIAPHTSAATVGRIIGFSRTQALLMHPFMHSAIRRNCDGDEGGWALLLDALINFSRKYLPKSRGGSMDAPLTLTLKVKGMEVDDELHKNDTVFNYPLEFYEATLKYLPPENVKIQVLKDRLGKEEEYYNWGFLHDIESISESGNKVSAYKSIKSMLEKLEKTLILAKHLRSVDPSVAASLYINMHLARDVRGNLRKFSEQEFRCVKCNEKYRRIPLSGKCLKCGGRIVFTVSEGTVKKYLYPSLWLADRLKLDDYTISALRVLKYRIEQTFGEESSGEGNIKKFFNNL